MNICRVVSSALHCAAPRRDNELFKVTVVARYGRFPPGPRGTQNARPADHHGRRHTRASSRSCIAEVDDLEEEREEERGEKKFKNANGGSLLRGQTILVERVSSCREAVEEVRLFFQVQGPEVVEPLTPTSVPFRSDFEEGIRVIDQRCFSLLSHRQLFFSLNISRYMLTLLEII